MEGLVVLDVDRNNWKQIDLQRVLSFHFIDNSNLIFLSYNDDVRKDRYGSRIGGIRAGNWNIPADAVRMGTYLETFEPREIVEEGEYTFSGDGSKLYWRDHEWRKDYKPLWVVQRDLALSPLTPPDRLSAGVEEIVFDQEGKRILTNGRGETSYRVRVWDLTQNRVLKAITEEYGGFTATLSPDGRWLAVVHGSREAPVIVWDLDLHDRADPAHSISAVCNLESSDCIRQLCEKVSATIDQRQLRDLVGDEAFDRLSATIGASRCGR